MTGIGEHIYHPQPADLSGSRGACEGLGTYTDQFERLLHAPPSDLGVFIFTFITILFYLYTSHPETLADHGDSVLPRCQDILQ